MFRFLYLSFFFVSTLCFSQQLPLHNQYIYNPIIINPAFAGVTGNSTICLSNRSQWIGFSDGIKTLSLSSNYALTETQGVGGHLFQDNTGAITITGLELDYSFKFPFFSDYSISLGLGLIPYQYLYNGEEVTGNIPDPTLDVSEKKTSFDANFGVFIYNDFLFGGFSVLNLIQSSVIPSLDDDQPNQLVRHYYALAGYNYFNETSKMGIEQTVLMRSTSYSGVQFDFNIKTSFNDLFWVVCGYRTNREFLAGFGIKYGRFGFIYNIDIPQGDTEQYFGSSHEFGIVFYLNKKQESFDWIKNLSLQ
tara:strand:+ start:292 stop:1206 length:915 start_codon:yes stop_codon:yes gene_type:complete